jgi:hypothetical protein
VDRAKEIERQLPNAYYSEYDTHRVHAPSEEVRRLRDMTSSVPLEPVYAPIPARTVVLTRRWVTLPGKGKGAVWCDEDNVVYGPVCFAGQRTERLSLERLLEPEGGW